MMRGLEINKRDGQAWELVAKSIKESNGAIVHKWSVLFPSLLELEYLSCRVVSNSDAVDTDSIPNTLLSAQTNLPGVTITERDDAEVDHADSEVIMAVLIQDFSQ